MYNTKYLRCLFILVFHSLFVYGQSERILRYRFINLNDTLLLELKSSILGHCMIWGKRVNDSIMLPQASLLIKADDQNNLWKLDHQRKLYSGLNTDDFPSELPGVIWQAPKSSWQKGHQQLVFNGDNVSTTVWIDTALKIPSIFHTLIAWHFPSWNKQYLKMYPLLQSIGFPVFVGIASTKKGHLIDRSLQLILHENRDIRAQDYFIPANWSPTGIPRGNAPGSPMQILPLSPDSGNIIIQH